MYFSVLKAASAAQRIATAVPKLEGILGAAKVKTATGIREQYSHDESHHEPHTPDLVVLPESTEEVSAIVKYCNENKLPVIPFGTGTGIEGGATPFRGGIVIDLKGLDQVLELDAEDFDVWVQPGVTRTALNERIRDTGLFFSVDPGADASVCGMVATGASGTTSVRYGTMKNNTKNLEVVLPNGEILHTKGPGRHPWKTSAGYNLTELFVGQEGTLGIITAACVQLHPRPQHVSAAVCGFPDVRAAIDAVVALRQCALPLARIEFLDDEQIKACNAYNKARGANVVEHAELPTLFLEFHGASKLEVEEQATTTEEVCTGNEGSSFQWSTDRHEIEALWGARHAAYYATLNQRKGAQGFSTDVCVPISKLPEVITATKEDLKATGIYGTIVGHVGEGNFHTLMPVFEHDEKDVKIAWDFSDRLVKRALAVGGTCTGEHGIGLGKRKYLELEYGPVGFEILKLLKRTFDPNNIMNPGKVIDLGE
uniref:D-lactate dehydrogenase (cytochrome) n=1 Tax=Panagrellus redivivus TaxID=6233 RepID=A0A7E4VHK0_PANRE